jgi:putative ABC transport system substrate-binding protein
MTLQVGPELDGKRLSLLREAAPGAKRVAFLTQAERGARLAAEAHSTAAGLGLELFTVHAKSAGELEAAFEEARNGRADAMLVTDWPAFNNRDVQLAIHSLARRHRLPVMHSVLDAADSGGLMSYAADIRDNYRRVPYFVDRILRGAKPADIPIEQPRRFELVVNLEAARAIGLSLAPSLLAQADRMVPAR